MKRSEMIQRIKKHLKDTIYDGDTDPELDELAEWFALEALVACEANGMSPPQLPNVFEHDHPCCLEWEDELGK